LSPVGVRWPVDVPVDVLAPPHIVSVPSTFVLSPIFVGVILLSLDGILTYVATVIDDCLLSVRSLADGRGRVGRWARVDSAVGTGAAGARG